MDCRLNPSQPAGVGKSVFLGVAQDFSGGIFAADPVVGSVD
jgi:hypothetical protein